MNSNDKYWCAFAKLTKTSSAFVNKLYEYFGSIEAAWNAEFYDLNKIEGLLEKSVNAFLNEKKSINPDECMDYLNKQGITFINPESRDYPYLLKQIDNPPIGLFVLGDLNLCNMERTIAVVGSRKASENAKNTLRSILSDFSNTDICIVSGLAEGIDTTAHTCAVENNMKTIAVIGGGFDKLYPKSNIKLFNKIIKEGYGAVISEYWPDIDAISWHFPVRNRIVSGLSKGILVAEAGLKSGAMITGKLALEQGRELMCMPGLISNPNTQGIYKLIKEGASIVTCSQDILDVMNWEIKKTETISAKSENNNQLTKDEKLVYECIQKDSLTVDELIIKTNLNINDLMVILTKLELNGLISQDRGERYILVE